MVYYMTHLTGRFRLCKKKDGSYVLQVGKQKNILKNTE